jgi:lycopene cyclase domain-containing protein
MSDYMLVLILSGAVPFLLSLYPPLNFYSNIKALFYSITLIVLIFGVWDTFATFRGHWHFNPSNVWNVRIVNLPVEEVLFFVVIPFCCILSWELLNYLRGQSK